MRAIVHAQQTNHDGRKNVYRISFDTLRDARRFVMGSRRPERAVIECDSYWETYENGHMLAQEAR